MKKYLNLFLIVGLVLILSGCHNLYHKEYNKSDVTKFIKNEIGIKNFDVSDSPRELDVTYDGEIPEKLWTIYDIDNDITFYVYDYIYVESETTKNKLMTDYYAQYYLKYEPRLNINNNIVYSKVNTGEWGDDEAPYEYADLYFTCYYSNDNELEKCNESEKYINNYFKNDRAIIISMVKR